MLSRRAAAPQMQAACSSGRCGVPRMVAAAAAAAPRRAAAPLRQQQQQQLGHLQQQQQQQQQWQPTQQQQQRRRPGRRQQLLPPCRAIEEKRDTAGSEASPASPDMLSQDQLQKLSDLRRQRDAAGGGAAPQPGGNIVQGALEEAQLISWPTPGKALLDTLLVLAIVSATGAMLFSLNVLLADASNWWYSH